MTLLVQWWFFVPFGKHGRVLHPLPVNDPQCPFIQMTDTDVTFLSCYNIVGHTRMRVMTLTSPPTLSLYSPDPGQGWVCDNSCSHTSWFKDHHSSHSYLILSSSSGCSKIRLWLFAPVFFPPSLGSCPDTQVMDLASSPPSSRCLPFRVWQSLRFLLSQFCRTECSVFRQQFHPCPCTRIMTLASSPPSARCPPFGTSVASISFPST